MCGSPRRFRMSWYEWLFSLVLVFAVLVPLGKMVGCNGGTLTAKPRIYSPSKEAPVTVTLVHNEVLPSCPLGTLMYLDHGQCLHEPVCVEVLFREPQTQIIAGTRTEVRASIVVRVRVQPALFTGSFLF